MTPGSEPAGPPTSRRTSWLILVAVLALVLTYLVVWTTYAGLHTYPRYAQLEPGAASTGEARYLVNNLKTTEVLAASEGGQDQPAPAGTVFVIATMQVSIDRPVDTLSCSLSLLGPGGRLWQPGLDVPRRALPNYCDSDESVQPGRPFTFENIFEVPSRYADQIRGIVITDPVHTAPEQVIIPA